MKKFFLFRREQLTLFSCCASDDGSGLALLVLPADKLSFITAKIGEVILRFDEASIYDYVTVASAESINKTRAVSIHLRGKYWRGNPIFSPVSPMNFALPWP